MKKIIVFLLTLSILFTLVGCSGNMTSAERFLLAVKKMDFSAMKNELLPDQKVGSLYLKLDSAPAEDSLLTLRNLYALVKYTVGEISEESNGVQTVEITLKVPDMERICSLAKVHAMGSGESAETIVGNMIADGSVTQGMMLEKTVSVKMVAEDGICKIPYANTENKAFAEALAIEAMIDFFAKY